MPIAAFDQLNEYRKTMMKPYLRILEILHQALKLQDSSLVFKEPLIHFCIVFIQMRRLKTLIMSKLDSQKNGVLKPKFPGSLHRTCILN